MIYIISGVFTMHYAKFTRHCAESLSILLNILYLFWIFTTAYNTVCIQCVCLLSLRNSPKKYRNIRKTKNKICKIKQHLSCFRTAEEEVENKPCMPLLNCLIFLECFIFVIIFANYYSSANIPGFPWMLPLKD